MAARFFKKIVSSLKKNLASSGQVLETSKTVCDPKKVHEIQVKNNQTIFLIFNLFCKLFCFKFYEFRLNLRDK
jgi:hypothetical protein